MWKLPKIPMGSAYDRIIAALVLLFTALTYYATLPPAPPPPGAILVTPWWVDALLLVGAMLWITMLARIIWFSGGTYDSVARKKQISGVIYKNQDIHIDGYEFVECTFENVTLWFEGKAPYSFINIKTAGVIQFSSKNPIIADTIAMIAGLHQILGPGTSVGVRRIRRDQLPDAS